MGEAFRIAGPRLAADRQHVTSLRDRLWARLQQIPGVIRNGNPEQSTGHILNVSVEGVEGESLHAGLGELAVASGSACISLTDEPSYVLRVLGRSAALSRSSVRFSFGRATTGSDIDRAAEVFTRAVADLRGRSPAAIAGPPDADSAAGEAPGAVLARGEAGSIEAGTWVVITACIRDERVERLDARVYGCPHTMAASDRLVQLLTGGTAAGLGTVDPLALGAALEIPVEKTGRLLIIQDALRNCLADWDNARLDHRRRRWQ
jgi:cysteine desulfurase